MAPALPAGHRHVAAGEHAAGGPGARHPPPRRPLRQPRVRGLRRRPRPSRPAASHAARRRPALASRPGHRLLRRPRSLLVPLDPGAQRAAARRRLPAAGATRSARRSVNRATGPGRAAATAGSSARSWRGLATCSTSWSCPCRRSISWSCRGIPMATVESSRPVAGSRSLGPGEFVRRRSASCPEPGPHARSAPPRRAVQDALAAPGPRRRAAARRGAGAPGQHGPAAFYVQRARGSGCAWSRSSSRRRREPWCEAGAQAAT